MYIYIHTHIYIYIYHAALLSGYVVVAPKTFEIKWHESDHWHHCVSFVWHDWIFVAHLIFFFAKQIGEFDWTWFHVQGFIYLYFSIDVQVGGHPDQSRVTSSQVWTRSSLQSQLQMASLSFEVKQIVHGCWHVEALSPQWLLRNKTTTNKQEQNKT